MNKLIYFITFFIFQGYYAGLAIIIAFGLTNFSRFYSIPIRGLTLLVMIYILSKNYSRLRNVKFRIAAFCAIFFWVLYFLKLLYHVNMDYSLFRPYWGEYIYYALAFCIFPFFTYASIDFGKYKETILNSLIFSGFVFGVVCLYLYRDVLTMGIGRISDLKYIDENASSETLNPLALSYGGVLTLVLCVYKVIYSSMNNLADKIYIYITILISLMLFFLGSSRGSMIALVMSASIFLYFGSYKIRLRAMITFALALPIFIYGAALSGSSIFDRLSKTVESGDEGRSSLWSKAWNEFANYPILGNRIEIEFYPHNIFLETLMSTGILGFIFLMILIFNGYRRVWKNSKIDTAYLIPFIIINQAVSQYLVTGALYASILLFFPLGIIYSNFDRTNKI